MKVQAYILNISAIQTIEELREMTENELVHTVESAMHIGKDEAGSYTAPKWIMQGDIIFFYHAATAHQHNRRLRKEVSNGNFEDADKLNSYLDYCDNLYKKYGGKIYAVGVVADTAYYSDAEWEHPHFKTRIFAPITNVVYLEYPLPAKQFKEFLPIATQQAITPVLGNDFMKLKSLILRYNDVPYLQKRSSVSIPIKDIQKGTWIEAANENGRRFLLEAQFRKYYVDYLLSMLSDDNKIHQEVQCIKQGKSVGRIDNVILMNGEYCGIEVKLNLFFDFPTYIDQIKRYAEADVFRLDSGFECKCTGRIIVIDILGIYAYSVDDEDAVIEIMQLDNIRCTTDVRRLKNGVLKGETWK